ncbi:MAG: hypothetical protein SO161_10185 [Treponema sp.]|nr:hypothetical protein [Treponema sp.]
MEKEVSFISYNEMLKQIEGQKNNNLLLGNVFNCSLPYIARAGTDLETLLLKYVGENGVASFTILGYSIFIFNMIAIGLCEGMSPLVSFCFGAKEKKLCIDLRVNVAGSMYFTSISCPKQSAVIAFLRGIFILLITIFVFPTIWGMDGIWLTSPVTEILTLTVTVIFCIKSDKLMKKEL